METAVIALMWAGTVLIWTLTAATIVAVILGWRDR